MQGLRYSFGDFVVEPATRKVTENGAAVKLGSRVFDLLQTLIDQRHRPMTKQELRQAIWPEGDIGDNNLTVAVSALRKTLHEPPHQQTIIRTVFGRGYRFVADVEVTGSSAPDAPTSRIIQAAPAPAAMPIIDRPSIAVMPFAMLACDPEDAHFGEGVAEDIITELSRNRWLSVIAQQSAIALATTQPAAADIAAAFNVRYVLKGSLRKLASHVRVNVQLADAAGQVLMAQRFDRDIVDLFALQDDITERVITIIRPTLYDAEEVRSVRRRPDNIDAWSAYQRGVWHFKGEGQAESEIARSWFDRAMQIDPSYAPGYYGMGLVLLHDGSAMLPHALPDWQPRGERLAEQAVTLDDLDSGSHSVLGLARRVRGDNEGSLAATERALRLNPSDAMAHGTAGATLIFDGRARQGIEALETSIRLSPRDPRLHIRQAHLGMGYFFDRQYSEAVRVAEHILRRWPDYSVGHRLLAVIYAESGDIPRARAAFQAAVAMAPKLFDDYTHDRMPWFRVEEFERIKEGLHIAGLPR